MSAFISNSITLSYGSTPTTQSFTVLSFEDDDVELVKLNKKLLTRNNIEQFIGYRKKYRIRFNKLSTTDLSYLYNYSINQTQKITFSCNGGTGSWSNANPDNITSSTESLFEVNDIITATGVGGSGTVQETTTTNVVLASSGFSGNFSNANLTISRTKNVKLISDLSVELFSGYIEAPSLTLEFEDDLLTTIPTTRPSYRLASETDSETQVSSTKKGVSINLKYNYGDGEVSRNFNVDLADSYSIQNEQEEFEYIDNNRERKLLGYYQLFNLDFGVMGRQSMILQQDDIEWVREFCLAPTKKIYISGLPDSESVICDFDEINYELVSSTIYNKALQLNFTAKNLQTNTNLSVFA